MKLLVLFCYFLFFIGKSAYAQPYFMPHETETHEGTWLQWPHPFEYGMGYQTSLDATWVQMTEALSGGEWVHIIAYDESEKTRILDLLSLAGISLTNIDFFLFPTNDVWIRDNGPIFVKDNNGNVFIEDWGFNGWGGKYGYNLCDPIPTHIGAAIGVPIIDLSGIMTNEGGSVELDGNGVLMACRSSVISQSPPNSVRNPGMTQNEAETIFSQYLGVSKFIWLDGQAGDPDDITDFHIDGFAKFLNDSVLLTMSNVDLNYWGVSSSDIATLYAAANINNIPYQVIQLPLTQNNVSTSSSINLGYKGSYLNYYVGNTVVLVPNYNDPNDAVANSIIHNLYPGRDVIGIDVRNLYENGGMVHCVTQQQPVSGGLGKNNLSSEISVISIQPNPFSTQTTIRTANDLTDASITITDCLGKIIHQTNRINGRELVIYRKDWAKGIYFGIIINQNKATSFKLVVND